MSPSARASTSAPSTMATVVRARAGHRSAGTPVVANSAITLHASRADSRRHLPAVLELAASGAFDPLTVPTTVVPFDDAAEAWLAPATKLVLTC